MSAHQPLFGMLTYQARHVHPRLRWPLLALPVTAATIPVADTSVGMVVLASAAVLIAVIVTLRWRWTHAAARIDEIVATELATDASASCHPHA